MGESYQTILHFIKNFGHNNKNDCSIFDSLWLLLLRFSFVLETTTV